MTRAGRLDYNLARSMLRAKIGDTVDPGVDRPLQREEPNDEVLSILECQIAGLWRKIPRVIKLSSQPAISWDSSFISVGGEPIRALKLRSEMEKALGLQVSVRDILGTSNSRELAVVVESSGLGLSALNVSLFCRLDITVDVDRLTTSLNAILTCHAVLRSKYHRADRPGLAFRTLSEALPTRTL